MKEDDEAAEGSSRWQRERDVNRKCNRSFITRDNVFLCLTLRPRQT